MRRSLEPAQLYTLLSIVVVGVPATALLLLGAPDLALPSDWSEARARINDGTYPIGAVINIVSVVFLLAWGGSLWLLVSSLLNRDRTTSGGIGPDDGFEPDDSFEPDHGIEPDEPWSRQEPPTLDEQSGDDYLGVVVPPDDLTLDIDPVDSVHGPITITADDSDHLEMLSQDAMPEDVVSEHTVSDAEIIGHSSGASPDDPPMIVPVRAYYFTRAEDTLRSISAQFLQSPRRWEELRALNAASPGVATAGPDTPLPLRTALALPGDPLPWGKPDPVYLWTLAEKFLFTAWGQEPTPEEVAPFWRGLTSGSQLEAGTSARPQHLAAPESATTPMPALETVHAPTPPPPETVHAPTPPGEFLSPSPPQPEHQPAPPTPQHQPAPPTPQHQPAPPTPQHQPAPPTPQHQPATTHTRTPTRATPTRTPTRATPTRTPTSATHTRTPTRACANRIPTSTTHTWLRTRACANRTPTTTTPTRTPTSATPTRIPTAAPARIPTRAHTGCLRTILTPASRAGEWRRRPR